MSKTFKLDELGIEVQIGKFASQADGAIWLKKGNTTILSTAVMEETEDFPGFLPLSVDYREQFSAAGKIPGGYLKREGKSSDNEVLTSRLIDRSIRPLFPKYFFNQVQVLNTVYSADKENPPSVLALLGSSLSLVISRIPFLEPVGAVQMGRIDGKWVVNPSTEEASYSDLKFIIAGTKDGICMVEGTADNVSEDDMVEAFFLAHDTIRKQVQWQEDIAKELQVVKTATESADFDWHVWSDRVSDFATSDKINKIFEIGSSKQELGLELKELKATFKAMYAEQIENFELAASASRLDYVFDVILKDVIAKEIIKRQKRVDGRNFEQVRQISTEVSLLPSVHGSALFTRGQTQALVSATLGSGKDAQKVDELLRDEATEKSFMLHYNFPPFSVGEARPMRGPGRREIGHGYLALSAINQVLPSRDSFPYTIRVISDILESNGSSSMATVCGTTMALMDAGVPIKSMVSGIAMGLLVGDAGEFQAITDITGFEDSLGLMDFKVAGTDKGITAIQMDIKYKGGLPRSVFEKALEQAKNARLHILGEMHKCMTKPNEDLSPLVPRIVTVKINPDKVGGVIGSGGKIIKEIIEKTGTTIDIEGSEVNIFGRDKDQIQQAVTWVKILADQIEKGIVLDGVVARTAEFGLFVDIAPGKAGLVHISKIARDKQRELEKHYPIGEALKVKVLDYDKVSGKIRLGLAE